MLIAFYSLFFLVSLGNLLLMRRLPGPGGSAPVAALIPARNEAHNLPESLGPLQGAPIYVLDDQSEDDTAEIARIHGAKVIPGSPLPDGWTGKNHACRQLAQVASEDFSGEWMLYLDADVRPGTDFLARVQNYAETQGHRAPVMTGFPRLLSVSLPESIYLLWVPWLLLATNPFGLVSRTGRGHNMFLNGQVELWKSGTYWGVDPHEAVKGAILEDVKIGRLLARRKVRVEVLNLSDAMSVLMYRSLPEAWRGMLKNSYEIADSHLGSWLIGLSMIVGAWAWLASGWIALALLLGSAAWVCWIVRKPLWQAILAPIGLTLGGLTFCASSIMRMKGRAEWKGRRYEHKK